MLKKLIVPLGIVLFIFTALPKMQAIEILPEFKASYFQSTDKRFRDIYHGAGLYRLELSVQAYEGIYPWLSVGYFRKTGYSLGLNNKTIIQMVPMEIGLKYLFRQGMRINPYLGLGLLVEYVHINNSSSFVQRRQSDWGVGGIAKAGFLAYITENFFLDFFADYLYMKINFNDKPGNVLNRRADLSGVTFGGGIGYRF